MRLNHLVRIRVTKNEKEKIKAKSQEVGFPTLNSYLRWAIMTNLEVMKDLHEIKYLLKNKTSQNGLKRFKGC